MNVLKQPARGRVRSYRTRMNPRDLVRFDVAVKETDLAIFADRDFSREALAAVGRLRGDLEGYAERHEGFRQALSPLAPRRDAPEVVRRMCEAARLWNVGPMAAVAGAFAQMVGEDLLRYVDEVIVENGGDIFVATQKTRNIAIFAGEHSPFEDKITVRVRPSAGIRGVCTSSGTVGPSLSFGSADAVTAFAQSAAQADAAATAIANRIGSPRDLATVVEAEKKRGALMALVVVIEDKMAVFGDIELV